MIDAQYTPFRGLGGRYIIYKHMKIQGYLPVHSLMSFFDMPYPISQIVPLMLQ